MVYTDYIPHRGSRCRAPLAAAAMIIKISIMGGQDPAAGATLGRRTPKNHHDWNHPHASPSPSPGSPSLSCRGVPPHCLRPNHRDWARPGRGCYSESLPRRRLRLAYAAAAGICQHHAAAASRRPEFALKLENYSKCHQQTEYLLFILLFHLK
jgi:hypothetical protein